MSKEPTQPIRQGAFLPFWLIAVILVASVAGLTYAVTSNYDTRFYLDHPVTVISSTTNTVSQTQTETSFSTQTLMSTVVSTANGNYYGNSNYPNYYNPYPNQNYQCQYPYYSSQCYGNGNQYQSYSGTINQSGSCILFYTSTGTYYLDLSHLNGYPTPNGLVTLVGYIESNYYQGGCGAYPLLYVEITQ